MELNIKDFDDLENYFKKKQQHTEELEHENIELTRENRQLKRELDTQKKLNALYINQLSRMKKSPVTAEDELEKYFSDISIPHAMKGREYKCQKK